MNYNNVRYKLIQECTMTSQLIKVISKETRFLLHKMKWERHVLISSKDNINR